MIAIRLRPIQPGPVQLRWGAALLIALLAGCVPQPTAAPEAARFLVYFDEVSANLTPAARQVVADAAGKAREIGARTVRIEGRASATGSPAGNQRLSETRAQATNDELQKDGVSPAIIQQVSIGPTGSGDPGVSERRVDIVLLK
jgi:OOP family OmpA-OmpF porin